MKKLEINQGSYLGTSFSQPTDSKNYYYLTNTMPQLYCFSPNENKCYWVQSQLYGYMQLFATAATEAKASDGNWYKTYLSVKSPGVCTIRTDQIC
jgi:hypothetical protein